MADKIKILFALILFTVSVFLPLVGIAAMIASALNLIEVELWLGALIAVMTFIIPFSIGVVFLMWVKDPGWVTAFLPFLFSAAYTFIPDFIPFSIDDAAAMTAGAIFSAFLAVRKNPSTPKWIFFPLIGAAIYTLFGGVLPGGFDEALVDIIALLVAGYGITGIGND